MKTYNVKPLRFPIGSTLSLAFSYNHRAQSSAEFHQRVVRALSQRYHIAFVDSRENCSIVSQAGSVVRVETTQNPRHENYTRLTLKSPGVWSIIKEMREAKVQDLNGLVKFLGIAPP